MLAAPDSVVQGHLKARVCIVGAGAAGIALACELDGAGLNVLLLEAGGLKPVEELADYYRGSTTPPHPDPAQFRRVVFGGTTGVWGGRCIPFDPIDLQARDYVSHSGWPIGYEELASFYPAAMKYCDAGHFDFQSSSALPEPTPIIPGLKSDDIIAADGIERYSLPTDFGARYRKKIRESGNVTAVLGLRCVRLVRAPGEARVQSIEVAGQAGQKFSVNADVFVLAIGGIEVPRMLLFSDREGPGFGNAGDAVGRYYMCHFENNCGRLIPAAGKVAFRFERTVDGVYCRRQLRFTPQAQQRHGLLNTAFRLHFPSYSDASHGSSVMSTIYLAKSALIPEYRVILEHGLEAQASPALAHVRNVVRGIPQLLGFAGEYIFRIKLARRKLPYTLVSNADGSYPLEFNSEQTPTASNRITLTGEVDRHGLPRVQVVWRLSEADTDSAYRACLLLQDSLHARGVCRLEFDTARLQQRVTRSVPLGGHHIGTARMASSPRDGVVDSNCAVFGLTNLFVASSAVFPTSGHANPTLTIVALAVRLARHLRARLVTR